MEIGDKRSVFDAPLHPHTMSLMAAIPVPDPDHVAQHIALVGEVPSPTRIPCTRQGSKLPVEVALNRPRSRGVRRGRRARALRSRARHNPLLGFRVWRTRSRCD
ncbi:MAG: hypothetical protein ACE5Q3_03145 [Alphaproteobacteria bacterium]